MLGLIRIIIIVIWGFISCLLLMALCLVRPFHSDNIYYFAALWGEVARVVTGVKFEVRNLHYLQDDSPSIIIANHQTNFDLMIASMFRIKNTVSLGKKEILWVPFFGVLFWLSGNVLINRKNRKDALNSMNVVKDVLLKKKRKILIMPEGTRSLGRGLGPFKKGAFHTAIYAQVPIVMICISSWHKFIDINRWNAGKIIIEVQPPTPTIGKTTEDVTELMNSSRQVMLEHLKRLDKEVETSKS